MTDTTVRIATLTQWAYDEAVRCMGNPLEGYGRYQPVVRSTLAGLSQADWLQAICHKMIAREFAWKIDVYSGVAILTLNPKKANA
jgi:hypothetical protein